MNKESQKEYQQKIEKIQKINSEILNQDMAVLEKLLIIAGALQVVNEGMSELEDFNIFKQDFKRKANNFANFIERSSGELVKRIYSLDEEYAQYLTQSIENYKKSLVGFIHADPAEIIARYYNAD